MLKSLRFNLSNNFYIIQNFKSAIDEFILKANSELLITRFPMLYFFDQSSQIPPKAAIEVKK